MTILRIPDNATIYRQLDFSASRSTFRTTTLCSTNRGIDSKDVCSTSYLLTVPRFDYFPSTNVFVLRMPAPIHEEIAASIVSDIVLQLHSISNGEGPASIFAKSVSSSGSTTIKSDDPEISRHDPDGSFKHKQAYSPGVILEVSYSQKRKDLLCLAEDYIYGSDGNIRVVVGIDIDYKDKSATLLTWRSQIQTDEAGEEELVAHQTSNQVC